MRLDCFLDVGPCPDLEESLKKAVDVGFRGIVVSASHPVTKGYGAVGSEPRISTIRTEVAVSDFEDWAKVILRLSPLDGLNSINDEVAEESKRLLLEEVAAANYVPAQGIILELHEMPTEKILDFLHHVVAEALPLNSGCKVVISIPYHASSCKRRRMTESLIDENEEEDPDTWKWWDAIRARIGDDMVALRRVVVNLRVPTELPSTSGRAGANIADVLARWVSDSLAFFTMPQNVFISRRRGRGYDLTGRHENLVTEFFHAGICPIVLGQAGQEAEEELKRLCLDRLYTPSVMPRNLLSMPPLVDSKSARFVKIPFQHVTGERTLMDIGGDPMGREKEDCYRRAIARAISILKKRDVAGPKSPLNIVLVGLRHYNIASLVVAEAKALKEHAVVHVLTPHQVTYFYLTVIYADVKNPYATVEVLRKKPDEWDPNLKIDLIISDAIGPFGADRGLEYQVRPLEKHLSEGGLVIPSRVTSFVDPIQCAHVYREAAVYKFAPESNPDKCWNIPWAALPLTRCALMDCLELQTLEFPSSPNPTNQHQFDYTIRETLDFRPGDATHFHGFFGFFEATLCDGIMFDNVFHRERLEPRSRDCDLFFMPLKEPFSLEDDEAGQFQIRKVMTPKAMWYEWRAGILDDGEGKRGAGAAAVPQDGSGDGTVGAKKSNAVVPVENAVWHNADGAFFKLLSHDHVEPLTF